MKTKSLIGITVGFSLVTGCSASSTSQTNSGNDSTEVLTDSISAQEAPETINLTDQAENNSNSVEPGNSENIKIEKGANLIAVLKASKGVTYEYNADSGIWAHIGNVSIIIDESQLNKKGIDFMKTITSDIDPDIAFSPDYLKPDAKILNIEKD